MSGARQRLLWVGLFAFTLAACSPSTPQGKPASAGTNAASPAASAPSPVVADTALLVSNEDAAIKRVGDAVQRHHLTSLRSECLSFMVEEDGATSYSVDVHENHTQPCGGDPSTSPRLFSFKVDRSHGKLTTDALDPADGDFQSIE
ncbi:hypothetical protein [Dyella tabacisoli]|uniref:Lipoprotein n=2 Tax=Dyella tabacisoli TaxID=2282381 RepID=A0A369UQU2_9GAMM|nr:hypothetical protein [Dyella tabacisoli]RDD83134.1 hypothetical protein DVJ77_00510 [Dyella tabacisoli]